MYSQEDTFIFSSRPKFYTPMFTDNTNPIIDEMQDASNTELQRLREENERLRINVKNTK